MDKKGFALVTAVVLTAVIAVFAAAAISACYFNYKLAASKNELFCEQLALDGNACKFFFGLETACGEIEDTESLFTAVKEYVDASGENANTEVKDNAVTVVFTQFLGDKPYISERTLEIFG